MIFTCWHTNWLVKGHDGQTWPHERSCHRRNFGTNENKITPYHSFGLLLLYCYSLSIYLAYKVQYVSSFSQTLTCLLIFVVPTLHVHGHWWLIHWSSTFTPRYHQTDMSMWMLALNDELKDIKSNWSPNAFITDYVEAKINSLQWIDVVALTSSCRTPLHE